MRAEVSALALLVVLGACASDRIEIGATAGADQNRGALVAAVVELRAARHSAAAYRAFTERVLTLRVGMDETVAEEAELLAVTEAVAVMHAAAAPGAGADALVLGLWPLGLAPPIQAPVPGVPAADPWRAWMPGVGEAAPAYLMRLCAGLLALECRDVVPEGQQTIVGVHAIDRFNGRVRRAVATCLTCSEPTWAKAVADWEQLARTATATLSAARHAHAPARWPVAGTAAVEPAAESARVRRVHLGPEARVELVRYALADARAAGAAAIALEARERAYPYPLRVYVIATATARLPVRDGEPVQMLTRALDAAARR